MFIVMNESIGDNWMGLSSRQEEELLKKTEI